RFAPSMDRAGGHIGAAADALSPHVADIRRAERRRRGSIMATTDRSGDFSGLASALVPAVLAAGAVEMRHYRAGVPVEAKSDMSPVTIADREAEAVLVAAIAEAAPGVAIIAEEAVSAGHMTVAGK